MEQHGDIDDLGVGHITLLDRVVALSYRPPPTPCDNMRSHFHELRCGHIVRTELETTCGLNCTSPMADIYGSVEVLELPFICPLCLKDEVAHLQRNEKLRLEQEIGESEIIDDLTWDLYWAERLPELTRQCTARGRICEEGDYAYLVGEDKAEETTSTMMREMKLGKQSKRGRERSRSPLRRVRRPQRYRSRSPQLRRRGKTIAKEDSRRERLEALVKPLYDLATRSAFDQKSVLGYSSTQRAVKTTALARSRSPSRSMTRPGQYRSRSPPARHGGKRQTVVSSDADHRLDEDFTPPQNNLSSSPTFVSLVGSQRTSVTSQWIQTNSMNLDDVLPLHTAQPHMNAIPQKGAFITVLPVRRKHRAIHGEN